MDFLGAAIRGQGLILFEAIDEEEIVIPQDGRLMHLHMLGPPVEPVFQPVLQNPDLYLMRRYAPVEEVPVHWEEYSGNNYLGVQQYLQEKFDASEQGGDTDNEEEDLDEEKQTMDCTKASSQDVEARSPPSQHVRKRDNSISDYDRMLMDIGSSSSSPSVAAFGLQDSTMPGASPPAFGPIVESGTTSEVRKL